ncbi:MAG: hypothetical protein K6C99_10265 [Lachnospiraceae bacterium]|nr:hypothetical protein [Lachnospiraceae bacterium]
MKNFIILGAMIAVLLTGCRSHPLFKKHTSEDEFSRAIKNEVGENFVFDEIYYPENGVLTYIFNIKTFDSTAVGNIATAFQSNIPDKTSMVELTVCYEAHPGAYAGMFSLINNYEEAADENHFILYIYYHEGSDLDYKVFSPDLYSQIEGINELHVDKEIQDIANEKGIDWYTYWPELETVVVEDNH